MSRPIYRKEALERLASPEQLDRLMQLTSPRGWLALAAVGLLFLGALLWGLFGTVAFTAQGQGSLVRPAGFKSMTAPRAGVVGALRVHPGDKVDPDQELLRLDARPAAADAAAVRSPYRGRVLDVSVQEGSAVAEGEPLVLLEPTEGPMQAVVYVSAADAYQVRPKMKVQVWPASEQKGESGSLVGQVETASRFPATRAAMLRRLGNEDLVDNLVRQGAYLEVVVALHPDDDRPGRYRWSSPRGNRGPLYAGTPCTGVITIAESCPLHLVFPALGDQRGP
jgi:hypothetical protein